MSDINGKKPMFERDMTRCMLCKRWWSVGPSDERRCPCGGDLEVVDMAAHVQSLPQAKD